MREPAEVVGGLIGGLADDGRVQAAADHARDVPERHALVGVTHICRNALLPRKTDEEGNEAVIAVAMDGRRKAKCSSYRS